MTRIGIVMEARRWIGTPYLHQASQKGVGCDCLGLLRGVWRGCIGAEPEPVPAYSPDWTVGSHLDILTAAAARNLHPVAIENAAPGDVFLFKYQPHEPARHCAILSSSDHIIHAYWRRAVCETALVPWWRNRVSAAFAFPLRDAVHATLSERSTPCD